MDHSSSLYAAWLGASGWVALALGRVAWEKRHAPGAKALVLLCLCLAQWSFTFALHWISPSAAMREHWLDWTFLGVVFSPVAVWLMVLDITRPGHRLKPLEWGALLSVGVITTLLLLLSDPGGLLFGANPPGRHDRLSGGPWFTVLALHGSTLVILSGVRLMQFAWRSSGQHRRQAIIMLVGLGIPFFASIGGVLGFRPVPNLDITPMLFMLTAAMFLWGVLGQRLFEVVPIARHQVVEQMQEGVVVLDERLRVVDLNDVARRSAHPQITSPLGAPVHEVFSQWPTALRILDGPAEQHTELNLDGTLLDLRSTLLLDGRQRPQGRIVVWRDVTAQRAAEQELQRAHQELQRRMADIEELQEQLREQNTRDPLTGLYNRRHLTQALQEQVAQNFGVVLLDIDHFKTINDTLGHPGGDYALQQVAQVLRQSLNAGESAFRYGGEEFLLLLPGLNLEQATHRAEQVRLAVAQQPVQYAEQQLSVTVSLGVAAAPHTVAETDSVLLQADQALYRAKHQGRNRVEPPAPMDGCTAPPSASSQRLVRN